MPTIKQTPVLEINPATYGGYVTDITVEDVDVVTFCLVFDSREGRERYIEAHEAQEVFGVEFIRGIHAQHLYAIETP